MVQAASRAYPSRYPSPKIMDVLYLLALAFLICARAEELYQQIDALQQMPVHIVWGTKAGTLPMSILNRWIDAAPRADEHRFAEAGHRPYEAEPTRFTELVRQLPHARSIRRPLLRGL